MLKLIITFIYLIIQINSSPTTKQFISIEDAWSKIPIGVNGTQCMFINSLMKFTCRGVQDIISCDAVSHLDGVKNDIFGIGRMLEKNKENNVRYWLYPRIINTTLYLNHTLITDKSDKLPINVMLYQGDKFIDFGVRVIDLKCYNRLVSNFDLITNEHIVELDSDLDVRPTVSLISEILFIDRNINRRAFAIESLGFLTSGFGLGFGLLG